MLWILQNIQAVPVVCRNLLFIIVAVNLLQLEEGKLEKRRIHFGKVIVRVSGSSLVIATFFMSCLKFIPDHNLVTTREFVANRV